MVLEIGCSLGKRTMKRGTVQNDFCYNKRHPTHNILTIISHKKPRVYSETTIKHKRCVFLILEFGLVLCALHGISAQDKMYWNFDP